MRVAVSASSTSGSLISRGVAVRPRCIRAGPIEDHAPLAPGGAVAFVDHDRVEIVLGIAADEKGTFLRGRRGDYDRAGFSGGLLVGSGRLAVVIDRVFGLLGDRSEAERLVIATSTFALGCALRVLTSSAFVPNTCCIAASALEREDRGHTRTMRV